MKKPKLLIEISGGNIVRLVSNIKMNVIYVDHDFEDVTGAILVEKKQLDTVTENFSKLYDECAENNLMIKKINYLERKYDKANSSKQS